MNASMDVDKSYMTDIDDELSPGSAAFFESQRREQPLFSITLLPLPSLRTRSQSRIRRLLNAVHGLGL
jgi:hypothetical protein